MNVLSLFDGMSCGMIALDRLGIKVDNYYASEIDKYAMQVSAANYPEIIQVGDITKLDLSTLPKIDLVMGGSPCQGFSFAGKQLAFDDPRSMLFFEFVKCVKELNPKYFLLENVKMKKEYLDIISEYMGVEPIFINSSLVSAQSRQRYYWTNIPNVEQPKDRNIFLKDILEDDAEEPMLSNIYGGFGEKKPRVHTDKSVTIRTAAGGGHIPSVTLKNKSANKQGKAYALTHSYNGAVAWNSIERKQRTMVPVCETNKIHPNVYDKCLYRKLTPLECERLQTVPDNYTNHVSNTQRYKMLGNGWTIEVIAHIFKNMEVTS
jgi:site-specific DNA-cytosine methylase